MVGEVGGGTRRRGFPLEESQARTEGVEERPGLVTVPG